MGESTVLAAAAAAAAAVSSAVEFSLFSSVSVGGVLPLLLSLMLSVVALVSAIVEGRRCRFQLDSADRVPNCQIMSTNCLEMVHDCTQNDNSTW